MPDTPTPGQVIYEGWLAQAFPACDPQDPAWGYAALSEDTRQAWEDVAQAVLALAQGDMLTLDLDPNVRHDDPSAPGRDRRDSAQSPDHPSR